MKNKHLTFEERIIIEEYLNKGVSVHKISLKLNRPDSSVVREIKRNRFLSYVPNVEACSKRYAKERCTKRFSNEECGKVRGRYYRCSDFSCAGCNILCNKEHCEDFDYYVCPRLNKSPFVCNGCDHIRHCVETFSVRYKYQARMAQVKYDQTLSDSRVGISLSAEEMQRLDNLVSPLLLNGQSIQSIFQSHSDEIPCSISTLYQYVDRCYFTARNIDMPRKVRFKTRYNHGPRSKSSQQFVEGRTFIDFQKYTERFASLNIWEMDTVIGSQDGKCLLTLLYQKTNFMIAILLDSHTQEAVINALNLLSEQLGIEVFQKCFQVLLTDRGIEFGNPYALECDQYGEIKTKVFYCDPYCSWQKGKIEKNHEFIRMVLPKGTSFDNLSQKDVHLMMNHINNYPRESLNGTTPYELSKLLLGQDFLSALHYHKIRPDDVILKEKLLRKPKNQ